MTCSKCGSAMDVIDSRASDTSVRRRRKCKTCGYLITTYEITAAQKAIYERSEKQYAGLKQRIHEMENSLN